MKGFLKSYFSYSRRQMRGLLVLVILILIVLFFPLIHDFFKEDEVWDHSEFKEAIQKIKMAQQVLTAKEDSAIQVLSSFDPNTATFEELQMLGFPDKQARTLIKYRASGGKFRLNEDLKKVYGIDNNFYQQIEPYIHIKKSLFLDEKKAPIHPIGNAQTKQEEAKRDVPKDDPALSIEINTADSTQLIRIRGIGASFARRIITYRNFLGGYYHQEQLLEVYGITPEILEKIRPQIAIDTSSITKINLNTADFKTLNSHPYIEYSDTKKILKFKELMGAFKSVDELNVNHLMDSVRFRKVKPYLAVN